MLFCKGWFDCFLRTIINNKKNQENSHKPRASPRAEEQMHSKNPKVWQIQKISETFQSSAASIRFKITFTTLQIARNWAKLVFKKIILLGRTMVCKTQEIISDCRDGNYEKQCMLFCATADKLAGNRTNKTHHILQADSFDQVVLS